MVKETPALTAGANGFSIKAPLINSKACLGWFNG
jgi:hypothetical protein